MKTLTISNQKGGVGKSTIATHLAMQANSMGLKVVFVDFDIQGNSSKFLEARLKDLDTLAVTTTHSVFSKSITPIDPATTFYLASGTSDLANINESTILSWVNNHKALSDHFDVCIVDTPPTIGLPQIAPMLVCDYVLSPIELSAFSIDGATNMLKTLANIKKLHNPNIEFLGLLPSRFNKNNNRQKTIYKDLTDKFNAYMYPNNMSIPERQAFADSSYMNVPIWEIKDHVAPKVSTKARPVFLDIINKITNK